MKSLIEIKTELQSILVENIEGVFETAAQYLASDSRKRNELILLQARYNSLKKDKMRGVISNENVKLNLNRITSSLLEFISGLSEGDLKKVDPDPVLRKLSYTDRQGNQFLLHLNELEASGLKSQAEFLVKKLNKLQEALILESDPTRQLRYETQIEAAEQEWKKIMDRLKN